VSGKVRRVELREREQQDAAQESTTQWRDDQFPELREGAGDPPSP